MKKSALYTSCFVLLALAACRKEKTEEHALPAGSVSIQALATADTIGMAVPVTKDTIFVIGLKAMLNGMVSATAHRVIFDVDTTRLASYQAKYGSAFLLPSSSYYFYQPGCSIPAGAILSDSAEINVVKTSKLLPLTTYVLPVIIRSVDGTTASIAKDQVVYLVVHTGETPFISKAGWKIVGYSSDDGAGDIAANVLDYDDQNTRWISSYSQGMPQYLAIDFGRQVTFSGVTYRTPSQYYDLGALYPTSIKIELSTNGTSWINVGTFGGQSSDATQTINTGVQTAHYLRFTVLGSVYYATLYCVVIGGIGLAP